MCANSGSCYSWKLGHTNFTPVVMHNDPINRLIYRTTLVALDQGENTEEAILWFVGGRGRKEINLINKYYVVIKHPGKFMH